MIVIFRFLKIPGFSEVFFTKIARNLVWIDGRDGHGNGTGSLIRPGVSIP